MDSALCQNPLLHSQPISNSDLGWTWECCVAQLRMRILHVIYEFHTRIEKSGERSKFLNEFQHAFANVAEGRNILTRDWITREHQMCIHIISRDFPDIHKLWSSTLSLQRHILKLPIHHVSGSHGVGRARISWEELVDKLLRFMHEKIDNSDSSYSDAINQMETVMCNYIRMDVNTDDILDKLSLLSSSTMMMKVASSSSVNPRGPEPLEKTEMLWTEAVDSQQGRLHNNNNNNVCGVSSVGNKICCTHESAVNRQTNDSGNIGGENEQQEESSGESEDEEEHSGESEDDEESSSGTYDDDDDDDEESRSDTEHESNGGGSGDGGKKLDDAARDMRKSTTNVASHKRDNGHTRATTIPLTTEVLQEHTRRYPMQRLVPARPPPPIQLAEDEEDISKKNRLGLSGPVKAEEMYDILADIPDSILSDITTSDENDDDNDDI